MRMTIIAGIIAAAALAAPAFANDTEDQCLAYTAENGGDSSGCSCLGEKAAADSALAESIAMIDSPEALDAADEATKGAIAACWPDSQG
jgi:hypothetical protein